MTDDQIQDYLRENGYPEHVVRGGRSGLIARYRDFIADVERGYTRGIEDYRNDLDIRGIIHLAQAENTETHALDERLRKLLTAAGARVWESAPGDPFWDFGYPENAGHALRADLRREKLLL